VDESTKAIREFNISVEKISKHGERIKELKVLPHVDKEEMPIVSLSEKDLKEK
jgi:hypothetical protein